MKAYKCDRCGKFFEQYIFQGLCITRNRMAIGQCLDLCQNCSDELQEWVTNGKASQESEDEEYECEAESKEIQKVI